MGLAVLGATPSLHREWRCARLARRDDREPGPPPRVVCAAGWQYREYLREEQRRQAGAPNALRRVGVETGCSAARMQMEVHHGLLDLAPAFERLVHGDFV